MVRTGESFRGGINKGRDAGLFGLELLGQSVVVKIGNTATVDDVCSEVQGCEVLFCVKGFSAFADSFEEDFVVLIICLFQDYLDAVGKGDFLCFDGFNIFCL